MQIQQILNIHQVIRSRDHNWICYIPSRCVCKSLLMILTGTLVVVKSVPLHAHYSWTYTMLSCDVFNFSLGRHYPGPSCPFQRTFSSALTVDPWQVNRSVDVSFLSGIQCHPITSWLAVVDHRSTSDFTSISPLWLTGPTQSSSGVHQRVSLWKRIAGSHFHCAVCIKGSMRFTRPLVLFFLIQIVFQTMSLDLVHVPFKMSVRCHVHMYLITHYIQC